MRRYEGIFYDKGGDFLGGFEVIQGEWEMMKRLMTVM